MTGKIFNKQNRLPAAIGLGVGAALAVEVAGAMAAAFLIAKEIVPQENMGLLTVVIHAISACIGGLAAGIKSGGKIALVCVAVSAALAAVWAGIGILFLDGISYGVGSNLLGVTIGTLAACGFLLLPKRSEIRKFSGYSR